MVAVTGPCACSILRVQGSGPFPSPFLSPGTLSAGKMGVNRICRRKIAREVRQLVSLLRVLRPPRNAPRQIRRRLLWAGSGLDTSE